MRRARRGERPGHSATTAHFQAAYPFLAEGGLGAPGTYIGRDAYGGAFLYDPWAAYEHGVLTGPNMLVVGQIGNGKSAFLKSYITRQHVFGRQAWALDPKSEYAPLARALGGRADRPCALAARFASTRSARVSAARASSSLLRSVAAAALRRELAPEEDGGLRVALEAVSADRRAESRPCPRWSRRCSGPARRWREGSPPTAESFAEAKRQVALALQRLCHGDLRGMFDGPTSGELDLDAPLVVLDLSAVQDSAALGILMTCAAAWLQGVVMERKRAAEARRGLAAQR